MNANCPGYLMTPLVDRQIEGQARAQGIHPEAAICDLLLQSLPDKRCFEAAELAALALVLSNDNVDSMAGAVLTRQGGWTAH